MTTQENNSNTPPDAEMVGSGGDSQYFRDKHVWEYFYSFNETNWKKNSLNLDNWTSLIALGITLENYDKITERNSPEMEKNFLLSAIKMYNYYGHLHMQRWLDFALELASMSQYEYNQNFKEVIDGITGYTPSKEVSPQTQAIRESVTIPEIAKDFGLEFNKRNKLCCPFHADGTPSLVYYPKTNSFFCFGCRASGDVIEFYRRLEELKNGA